MDLPINLIVAYVAFSIFAFYQKLHLKNFQGASKGFGSALTIYVMTTTIFGLGFLIFWGVEVSWLQAGILFIIALAIQILWFPVEAMLRLQNLYPMISMAGFIAIPIAGYFMLASLP